MSNAAKMSQNDKNMYGDETTKLSEGLFAFGYVFHNPYSISRSWSQRYGHISDAAMVALYVLYPIKFFKLWLTPSFGDPLELIQGAPVARVLLPDLDLVAHLHFEDDVVAGGRRRRTLLKLLPLPDTKIS